MKTWWLMTGLIVGAGVASAGCTGDTPNVPARAKSASDLASAPPQAAGGQTVGAGAPASAGPVSRLLAVTEAVGPEAEARFQGELRAFMATPGALADLEAHYAGLPLAARSERWKAVHLLGKVPSPAALRTLEQIAIGKLKPAVATATAPAATTTEPGTGEKLTDQPVEREAAMALAVRAAAGEEPAFSAVASVLTLADPEVARSAALELFAAGKLDDSHRKLLQTRGIGHNFRRLSRSEEMQLFTVSHSDHAPPRKSMSAPPEWRNEQ